MKDRLCECWEIGCAALKSEDIARRSKLNCVGDGTAFYTLLKFSVHPSKGYPLR